MNLQSRALSFVKRACAQICICIHLCIYTHIIIRAPLYTQAYINTNAKRIFQGSLGASTVKNTKGFALDMQFPRRVARLSLYAHSHLLFMLYSSTIAQLSILKHMIVYFLISNTHTLIIFSKRKPFHTIPQMENPISFNSSPSA